MPVNNFLVFDTTNGNKMSQTDYAAATARLNGVGSGTASSPLANKTWAQSSIIAAMIAQFINDETGQDAIDDGTITTLLSNFKLAVTDQSLLVPGRLLNVRVFSTPGTFTYTPTAGTTKIVVHVQGGGAAGGGLVTNVAGNCSVGIPGSSGAYGSSFLTSGFSGATITVGVAGNGVSGADGGNGGTSSFGAFVSAPGGSGGIAGASQVGSASGGNGNPVNATGYNLTHAAGTGQFTSFIQSTGQITIGGSGGSSVFGPGGIGSQSNLTPTSAASSPGSGGGGTCGNGNTLTIAGANGAPGIVMIEEYS